MNCRQAEELFSDYRDRALAPPRERELATHLDTCDACQELYRAFEDVIEALGALQVPAPGAELSGKLLHRLPTKGASGGSDEFFGPSSAPSPRLVAGASWLAVAAVLAMVLVFRPPGLASDFSRATSRTARHVYSFAVGTYHQTERWVEDLNVLRMTVGVAFEDRLDQINEQLRDLEDAGQRSKDDEQSRGPLELDRESDPRERVGTLSHHSSRSFS